jgi:hypothetical protein
MSTNTKSLDCAYMFIHLRDMVCYNVNNLVKLGEVYPRFPPLYPSYNDANYVQYYNEYDDICYNKIIVMKNAIEVLTQ